MADAKDKIALQVSQASYKMSEAAKNYKVMRLNREKAEENLRMAMAGFREGVLPAENVMEAQTAWLKSQSETIDAAIDMRLCEVYLDKVLGKLNVEEK